MSYNTKQHRLPNKPPKERNNMPENNYPIIRKIH